MNYNKINTPKDYIKITKLANELGYKLNVLRTKLVDRGILEHLKTQKRYCVTKFAEQLEYGINERDMRYIPKGAKEIEFSSYRLSHSKIKKLIEDDQIQISDPFNDLPF